MVVQAGNAAAELIMSAFAFFRLPIIAATKSLIPASTVFQLRPIASTIRRFTPHGKP
jgi:hypothetical protein